MRSLAVVVLAFCTAACVAAPAGGPPAPVLACNAGSDLCAVYTPGARNVRVVLVRPPSIVLMRERFVPAGQAIGSVQWSGTTLIVDTGIERYALDSRTGRFSSADAADMTASTHARRGT